MKLTVSALMLLTVLVVPTWAGPSDKTLVAWIAPANLDQQGGSALTVQVGDRFDAIVLGERARGKWMAGSEMFNRTQIDQSANAAEAVGPDRMVQVAVVYERDQVRLYRDGRSYASYAARNVDLLGADGCLAIFGLRHIGAGTGAPLAGSIDDARIYDRALSTAEVRSLRPNEEAGPRPLAWWDFNGAAAKDRAGHFGFHATSGGVKLSGGRLVLDGRGYLLAARTEAEGRQATLTLPPVPPAGPYVPDLPAWPETPPTNWVTFHLAHPGPGPAMPGDPNCVFDYKGKVHLHYIYRGAWGFAFAHVSSDDMVRWTWHKTVLAPPTTGHGMFSGTGFYTREGRPAIIYHGEGRGRNVIQFPTDDSFDGWTGSLTVLPRSADGTVPNIRHWDPDCWPMDDAYYAYSGGKNPQLMKSADLKDWTYLGDLLHPDYPPNLGVPKDEDISCGNMFRIGDKWMLLCISHTLGARYYLGGFKDEKYLPTRHAMMSFGGNQFFAPESVLTRDGRRVMWAWLLNLPVAPTGVQSLPRELELPADGVLRIRPLRELVKLRHDGKAREDVLVADGASVPVPEAKGDAVELELKVDAPLPAEFAVDLLGDEQGRDGMSVVAGAGRKTLRVGTTEPPFELAPGEDLALRVFIDKNLVEVFANDRQAAVFAVKGVRAAPAVSLRARGGPARVRSIRAWRLRTIYKPDPSARAVSPAAAGATWQGIPGLERTAGGRVFVSWYSGGPREPSPENTVYLAQSDDQGETFTPPTVMAGPRDGARAFDPTLWVDPDGKLWYIFNRGDRQSAEHAVFARVCDDPDAKVPIWSDERRLDLHVPYAFRMNKPTVLSTGEWVLPVTHAPAPVHDWFAGPSQLQGVGTSTDRGKTWTLHGAVKAPPWALECMIVELRDGRLWMLTRTGGGVLWQSHSTDRGRTWGEARPTTLANPGSRFFIRRLASGRLLLVDHYRFKGRSHLTARLSSDDGATWNDGLLLDDRSGVSYPDGVQDRDGLVWIVYDRDRQRAGEVLLARFREEDALAGKDVSGAVRLRQVVSRLAGPDAPR